MVFIWGALYEFLFYTSPIRESGSNHRPPQSLFAGRRVDENFGSYEFLKIGQILFFVLVQRILYQSELLFDDLFNPIIPPNRYLQVGA